MLRTINIFYIAKKNLRRKPFRSISIALSVTVVAAILFPITTVIGSVETGIKRGIARLGADIMVVPADAEDRAKTLLLAGEPSTFYMARVIEKEVREIDGVSKTASQVFLKTAQYAECCDVSNLLLIGFDPEDDFTLLPWLSGRLKKPLSYSEVIIGMDVALTAYSIGSVIKLYGMDFKVAGMLEETGMKFIDSSIFVPLEALRRAAEGSARRADVQTLNLPTDQISTVLVKVAPGISPRRVAIFIEHAVPEAKAIVSEQLVSTVRRQLSIALRSIISISIILWVMALLLISTVFSMAVNERQREIGLLRAMGAKKKDVFRLIMTEVSILSIAGGVIGIVCGGTLLYLFREFIRSSLNIPYLWPSVPELGVLIVVCLLFSLITGAVSALYPAIRSAGMEPYEAIRGGE